MTKYRESKAPTTTSTYDRNQVEGSTKNIYEAISIISKRSSQINLDIKKELHEKLDEFATHNDSLEEIFENRERRHQHHMLKDRVDAMGQAFGRARQAYLTPVDRNVALIGLLEAGKHAHDRGFASPVFTQKRVDLAFCDVK